MPESIDVYSDSFQVNLGPWGSTLNFQLSSHQPPAPGSQPQNVRVATIRTSLAHLKVMTMLFKQQISKYERNAGVVIEVPTGILSGLGIAKEDWDSFWKPVPEV